MLQALHSAKLLTPFPRKANPFSKGDSSGGSLTGGVTPGVRVPVAVPQLYPTKRLVWRETVDRPQFVCSAEAQSPNETPTVTSVINYMLGRGNYQFVSAFLTVFAVSIIAAAPMVGELVMNVSLLPVGEVLYRAGASLLLIPAATACIMQSAVADNRLDSPTYKRLSFVLAATSAAMCGFKCYSAILGQGLMTTGLIVTAVIQMLPTVAFFKLYGMSTMQDIIPGFISGVTSLFQPDNINSALYALGSVVTMGYALVGIVRPTMLASLFLTQSVDVLGEYMIRSVALLTFQLSIVLFSLKDAADRERLGFGTFRNLNIAVLLTSLSKIGNAFYMTQGTTAAAATTATTSTAAAGAVASPVTRFHWIGLFSVYGTLALLSGFNAIMAKKE